MKKYLMLTVAMTGVVAGCTPPEEAVRQSHVFCDLVAVETGHSGEDFPEWELGCVERGARHVIAQERVIGNTIVGGAVNVASGVAVSAAGVKLADGGL